EAARFGVAFEVIGGVLPAEVGVEDEREEQVVAVVHDDQLTAGTLQRGVVDEVLLGAVRPDVALQGELARDDLFDGDLLVPAVAAVLLVTAGLGDVLRSAEGTARTGDGP